MALTSGHSLRGLFCHSRPQLSSFLPALASVSLQLYRSLSPTISFSSVFWAVFTSCLAVDLGNKSYQNGFYGLYYAIKALPPEMFNPATMQKI